MPKVNLIYHTIEPQIEK